MSEHRKKIREKRTPDEHEIEVEESVNNDENNTQNDDERYTPATSG